MEKNTFLRLITIYIPIFLLLSFYIVLVFHHYKRSEQIDFEWITLLPLFYPIIPLYLVNTIHALVDNTLDAYSDMFYYFCILFTQILFYCFAYKWTKTRRTVLCGSIQDPILSEPLAQERVPIIGNLDKESLEEYMTKNKPYLNPKLKITDLIHPLCTNRTYLSSFINKTYGVNFNRFINQYRLKEVEQMVEDPIYSNYSKLGLIIKAGFTNYQAYLRIRKREREK